MEYKKFLLKPKEYHKLMLKLSDMIPRNKYSAVYGVPRGGSVIATYLSHFLKLDYITSRLSVSSRGKEVLIVDDIAHKGKTIAEFVKGGYDTATIFYKRTSSVKPTYHIHLVPDDVWVVFPYERTDEEPNR